MEFALDEEQLAPAPRLLELRAGLYVVLGLVMIAAAVARPEARLIAVAIILSAALLPALIKEGHSVTRLEAAVLSDILAGAIAWILFPNDPIFGLVITVWAVALAAFLSDRGNALALFALAIVLEIAKIPIAAMSNSGWIDLQEFPPLADVAITSAVGIVVLGLVYGVFRNMARFLSRSRRALQRTRARYESLVEAAPTPVLVLLGDHIVYANRSARDVLGQDQLIGRSLISWLTDDDKERAVTAFARVLETGEPIVAHDHRLLTDAGREIFVDASIAPVQYREEAAVQIVLVDVSDRHRAEVALRVSEERFRTAFEHSATPFALIETDTSFSQVNGALTELLGYQADELVGATWRDIIHADDVSEVLRLGFGAMQGEYRTFECEVRMVTKSGDIRWARLDVASLLDDAGNTTRFITLAHDVSEQRAARQALAESEERYRTLFERIPVALYRTMPDGTIVDGNPALAELLGSPLEELMGANATEFYARAQERDVMAEKLAAERVVDLSESELHRRDGSSVWVRDSARIVESGDEVYFEGALVDVSARRLIEEALRVRARQQEAIAALGQRALEEHGIEVVFETAVDAVHQMLKVDLVAVFRHGDSDPLAFRGELPSEVASALGSFRPTSTVPILLPTSSDVSALSPAVTESGLVCGVAVPIAGTDGPVGSLWALSKHEEAFQTEDITFLLAVGSVLAAANERHESRMRLEHLVRSKDEFVASVSHELRTPLTVVTGMAHELRDSWDAFGQAERAEFLEMLVDQSKDMSDLIEDLLVAARADIGTVSVSIQRVDLAAEVEGVLSAIRSDGNKRITVEEDSVEALADPIRVRQIARNLLTNALRYGGDEIRIAMKSDGYSARLVVHDNGPGVPNEDHDRIFQPYHRAHHAVGMPGSVGLGLTVSRALAELMGGSLSYRYEDGSVFELSLPAAMSGRATAVVAG